MKGRIREARSVLRRVVPEIQTSITSTEGGVVTQSGGGGGGGARQVAGSKPE